jgi:hypothetical protein
MGTERRKPRKHVYVSLACVMLFMASACSPDRHIELFSSPTTTRTDCRHLKGVSSYIKRGDFEGAAKASQDIYDRSPNMPPGDEALMNMGLISIHYANPKKDYQKALGYFLRLEREFPTSPLVEEAKTWAGVIQAFEKSRQVDIEIEQKKKELGH